jgi:hypothetical protein
MTEEGYGRFLPYSALRQYPNWRSEYQCTYGRYRRATRAARRDMPSNADSLRGVAARLKGARFAGRTNWMSRPDRHIRFGLTDTN